jgi:hypothetical protein
VSSSPGRDRDSGRPIPAWLADYAVSADGVQADLPGRLEPLVAGHVRNDGEAFSGQGAPAIPKQVR